LAKSSCPRFVPGAREVELNYDTFGDDRRPAVLLIMGLTCQKVRFPTSFCKRLASAGFHVIRYDNRDIGHSASGVKGCLFKDLALFSLSLIFRILEERKICFSVIWLLMVIKAWHHDRLRKRALFFSTWFASLWAARWYHPKVPYTVADMGDDALQLMNTLKIPSAHVVGYSMGGMVSQYIAHHSPTRVSSLSLLSTCSPNTKLTVTPGLWTLLRLVIKAKLSFIPGAPKRLRVQGTHDFWMYISAPGQEESQSDLAVLEHSRASQDVSSLLRQAMCILDFCSGDKHWASSDPTRKALRTLVIHGLLDNLVPVGLGFDLATRMNCRCVVLPFVSHDSLPAGQDDVLEELKAHLCRATSLCE